MTERRIGIVGSLADTVVEPLGNADRNPASKKLERGCGVD
jgi:hypothetical protein